MWKTIVVLALAACCCTGCGVSGVLGDTRDGLLITLDVLTPPRRRVDLEARLRTGDLLRSSPGYVIVFRRAGQAPTFAQTDDQGAAKVAFTPPAEGDYQFTAAVSPVGLRAKPPHDQALTIYCRKSDCPIAVVDLDYTIVAGGFEQLLLNRPGETAPMAHSQEVLAQLAASHTIVYLTHRPNYFTNTTRQWLRDHRFPRGPLLLAEWTSFLRGSSEYKAEALTGLQKDFSRVELGIGNRIGDVQAYHDSGMKSFLIFEPPDAPPPQLRELAGKIRRLPQDVQVVSSWRQIGLALNGRGTFPPSAMAQRLEEMARRKNPSAAPTSQGARRTLE
ncbi:MAG: phosphatase domain-containing protein [Planctomycetaceae bacterium]|nr:hypothetical protein [Planctomycetaceae bacterium]